MREAPAFWGRLKLLSEDPSLDKVNLRVMGFFVGSKAMVLIDNQTWKLLGQLNPFLSC